MPKQSDIDRNLATLASLPATREESASGIPADCRNLTPLLKALLVADGTVTVQLAAAFDERIGVAAVFQRSVESTVDIPIIGVATGDNVFYRQVELIGTESGDTYATAWSVLNGANMDPLLFEKLIDEELGMGEVLRNSARGSFREVLRIARDTGTNSVTRSYAVFLERTPCIVINETFPLERFGASLD
ncbi:MAG: DUF98 domain-containing protein [Pseudomonadales bacterium]|nr:DUF98 domain-containing protein [Pseudomonadales bacterium]